MFGFAVGRQGFFGMDDTEDSDTCRGSGKGSGNGHGKGGGKGLQDAGLLAGFTAEQLAGFDAVGEVAWSNQQPFAPTPPGRRAWRTMVEATSDPRDVSPRNLRRKRMQ